MYYSTILEGDDMSNKVYIGWDKREGVAFEVARNSIQRRTNSVDIVPLVLSADPVQRYLRRPIELRDGKMWCPISGAPMATEFAISRFVVPFLHQEGWALFVDCDILCLADIADLFALADPKYAIMVVKHKHETGGSVKMDGQVQTYYSRKNWSSVMLWNCDHSANKLLNLNILNTWPGRDLHAFNWLKDEYIGELGPEWNYLVGVGEPILSPKLVHYTLGTPNMPGYENCSMSKEWWAEKDLLLKEAV